MTSNRCTLGHTGIWQSAAVGASRQSGNASFGMPLHPLQGRSVAAGSATMVATTTLLRRSSRDHMLSKVRGSRSGFAGRGLQARAAPLQLLRGGPTWGMRRESRRPGRRATCMALDPGELSPAALAAGVSVLSFGILRAVVYFRMQYITAARVARHVPRGGARLVDLSPKNAAGRNLFYLPKDAVQVTVFDGQDKGAYLQELGIRAGVPVDVRSVPSDKMNLPPASVDAVVSVYGLSGTSQVQAVLQEAARVLKPGKPFIFVENVASQNGLVRNLQSALAGVRKVTGLGAESTKDTLNDVQAISGFEEVQCERIWDWQDPHIVGVAVKAAAPVAPARPPASALERQVDSLASFKKGKRRRGAS